jgi:two-component system response regulator NreC
MNCEILIADNHPVFRAGLKSVLQLVDGLTVCAECDEGRDVIAKVKQLRPHLVIASLSLPRANGLVLARRLLATNPKLKLLIVITSLSKGTVQDLLRAGVHGLVSKSNSTADFLEAVEALRRGRTYFPSVVDKLILDGYLTPQDMSERNGWLLTTREYEVVQILAEGATTKDIAMTLGISVKTAETHRHRLMRKLHCHNVAELTMYAISHDILQVPVPLSIAEFVQAPACTMVRHARDRSSTSPNLDSFGEDTLLAWLGQDGQSGRQFDRTGSARSLLRD